MTCWPFLGRFKRGRATFCEMLTFISGGSPPHRPGGAPAPRLDPSCSAPQRRGMSPTRPPHRGKAAAPKAAAPFFASGSSGPNEGMSISPWSCPRWVAPACQGILGDTQLQGQFQVWLFGGMEVLYRLYTRCVLPFKHRLVLYLRIHPLKTNTLPPINMEPDVWGARFAASSLQRDHFFQRQVPCA